MIAGVEIESLPGNTKHKTKQKQRGKEETYTKHTKKERHPWQGAKFSRPALQKNPIKTQTHKKRDPTTWTKSQSIPHKQTKKCKQSSTQINTKETQTTRKKGKVSTAVIDDCAFVVVVVIVRKQASAKTQKNWLRTVSKKKKKKSSA